LRPLLTSVSRLSAPLAEVEGCRIIELIEADIAVMQALYDANPEYSLLVMGRAPQDGDAHAEFHDRPPAEFSMGKKWMLGFVAADDELIGVAEVVSDLFADSVWHIGYFMVATAQHGSGLARRLYDALEGYIRSQGANWLRLGVVVGNARAEQFWQRCGFIETRTRDHYPLGEKIHVVRVMVKPLTAGSISQYLALVPRDCPTSTSA
jgi:ribosomal protein S18 acetylase RimI-like enzyme